MISLGQAVPFFAPPESALNAARAALDTPEVNRYSTDPGLPSLRGVLAERLEETIGAGSKDPASVAISAEDLVITPPAGITRSHSLLPRWWIRATR